MSITELRALVQFIPGSHTLAIEQGRFARPALPRNLTAGNTQALGDELDCVLDCRHFCDIRAHLPSYFQNPFSFVGCQGSVIFLFFLFIRNAVGCMRLFTWHKDQKSVGRCIVALLQNVRHDHNPALQARLAEWTYLTHAGFAH